MKYFLTTAIDYVNGSPHIGHAYEKVLADVLIRERRMRGEAYLLIGVDQHGQKVQQSAEREGLAPATLANRNTTVFLKLWDALGISNDGWAATTDPRHKKAVQRVLENLENKGDLYKATYSGYYSVRQEQFLTDKERNENGEFGPEWGEVVLIQEENWYFRLAKHKDWLLAFLRSHPDFVTPAFRHAELTNAVERLSDDLCISRPKQRLAWGIEFPFDPEYVTYVWFDALLNYVTFAGHLAEPGSGLPDFADLWPCKGHIIGKDILIPAHGVYWPIMLHAMGFPDEQMPRLLVHGFWNMEGGKMSKSLGNVIDPFELHAKYGRDAVRFYLMRDIATGQDADFRPDRLVSLYNSELANDLGNLVNRSLNMVQRYRSGVVRRPDVLDPDIAGLEELARAVIVEYHSAFDRFLPNEALAATWRLVSQANALVDLKAPWHLAKEPIQSNLLDLVLYTLAESARLLASLIYPVMPDASQKILTQLNVETGPELHWGVLKDGHQLGKPVPVFPRIEA
jgi:methionyl-tRNA synthetase